MEFKFTNEKNCISRGVISPSSHDRVLRMNYIFITASLSGAKLIQDQQIQIDNSRAKLRYGHAYIFKKVAMKHL